MQGWKMRHKLRWMVGNIRRGGIGGLWRELHARLSPQARAEQRRNVADGAAFDADGFETSALAAIDAMDTVGSREGARHYQATPSYAFDAAMAMLDVPVEGATFLDLGSGKGRVVLMSARRPFARIVGVEFARELHEIATANLRRWEALHGPDPRIVLLNADARDLAVPPGPLIVFLFNSFGPPVLTTVVARLRASWEADRRPLRVIYLNAQHPATLLEGGFRAVAVAPDFAFTIYGPT